MLRPDSCAAPDLTGKFQHMWRTPLHEPRTCQHEVRLAFFASGLETSHLERPRVLDGPLPCVSRVLVLLTPLFLKQNWHSQSKGVWGVGGLGGLGDWGNPRAPASPLPPGRWAHPGGQNQPASPQWKLAVSTPSKGNMWPWVNTNGTILG